MKVFFIISTIVNALCIGMLIWIVLQTKPGANGVTTPNTPAIIYQKTPTSKTSSEKYDATDLDQFLARIDAYLGAR